MVLSQHVAPMERGKDFPRDCLCSSRKVHKIEFITHNDTVDTRLTYAITMDDATYRNTQISRPNFGPTFNTTFLGNCKQSNCISEEDLIEVSVRTPIKFTQNGVKQTAIPSASTFTPGTIDWQVDYADGRYSEYPEQSSGYFVYSDYELDTKFLALVCILSGDCVYDASILADAPVMDYSVQQNGGSNVKTETHNQFEGSTSRDPYLLLVASLGERCNSSSLSGGAIASIVIASIVVFVAVVGGLYLLHKKNQRNKCLEEVLCLVLRQTKRNSNIVHNNDSFCGKSCLSLTAVCGARGLESRARVQAKRKGLKRLVSFPVQYLSRHLFSSPSRQTSISPLIRSYYCRE